jgi:hypothetical protein
MVNKSVVAKNNEGLSLVDLYEVSGSPANKFVSPWVIVITLLRSGRLLSIADQSSLLYSESTLISPIIHSMHMIGRRRSDTYECVSRDALLKVLFWFSSDKDRGLRTERKLINRYIPSSSLHMAILAKLMKGGILFTHGVSVRSTSTTLAMSRLGGAFSGIVLLGSSR